MESYDANQAPFDEKWRVFRRLGGHSYIHYEEMGRDYYPIENMDKLAALFDVPVTELLDDFNMFLYNDQGKQIREKRMSLNMTQREYAAMLGVPLCNLKKWEMNRVRIFKSTWEKYFR